MRDWKYIFCLHKAYFDNGFNILKYLLYMIALFGVASENLDMTMWLGVAYGISSYLVGYAWFNYGFYEASIEVGNQFNRFVKELRTYTKKGKV